MSTGEPVPQVLLESQRRRAAALRFTRQLFPYLSANSCMLMARWIVSGRWEGKA